MNCQDEVLPLIDAKVQWETLDEIFIIKKGYTPSKSKKEYWQDGTIPFVELKDLRLNGGILDDVTRHVNEKGIKRALFPANSILMSTSATIGKFALVTVEHLTNESITNFAIKEKYAEKLDIKFTYYYFSVIAKMAKNEVNVGRFPMVKMPRLKKILFPIPPLEEQARIVSILDTFANPVSGLIPKLNAELEDRKLQYKYYLNLFINFSEDNT